MTYRPAATACHELGRAGPSAAASASLATTLAAGSAVDAVDELVLVAGGVVVPDGVGHEAR
jgi:hypothetical protein